MIYEEHQEFSKNPSKITTQKNPLVLTKIHSKHHKINTTYRNSQIRNLRDEEQG